MGFANCKGLCTEKGDSLLLPHEFLRDLAFEGKDSLAKVSLKSFGLRIETMCHVGGRITHNSLATRLSFILELVGSFSTCFHHLYGGGRGGGGGRESRDFMKLLLSIPPLMFVPYACFLITVCILACAIRRIMASKHAHRLIFRTCECHLAQQEGLC